MRVKPFIISLFLVLILVMFNRVFLNTFNRANSYFATETLYSNEIVQPQKLFEKTWKVIYKDYYDPSMNNQNWERWKNRYANKIQTEEDALKKSLQEHAEETSSVSRRPQTWPHHPALSCPAGWGGLSPRWALPFCLMCDSPEFFL